ncbi:MAG: S8 family serine peptidase [Planctomycetota bacterium]|nr:S8 family serine peptidase [Planctomycetota bacterium]
MEQKRSRWRRLIWMVALLGVTAHAAPPAGKGNAKTTTTEEESGGINPSSIAVIETDFTASTVEPVESYDTVALTTDDATTDKYALVAPTPEEQISAAATHTVATGRGVVVAVLDGGFDCSHPAICASMLPGFDAIDGDSDPTDLGNGIDEDLDGIADNALGHGNFVTSTVLRAAPDAWILPIRVRDDEGWGTNQQLVRGMRYAIAAGANVINLALSTESANVDLVYDALAEAERAGVTVVVSAGNAASWQELDDLGYANTTVVVGAVDAFDVVASFSNSTTSGAEDIVWAPGVDLYGPMQNGMYGTWSGTSFATGFVSGGVALCVELNPGIAPRKLRRLVTGCGDAVMHAGGEKEARGRRINLWELVR